MAGYNDITLYKSHMGTFWAYVIFTDFNGRRWAVTLDGKSSNQAEAEKNILEKRPWSNRCLKDPNTYGDVLSTAGFMELTKEKVKDHNYNVSKYGGIPIDTRFINK